MSFEVRVPASSANLGPGFDSLAVALSLYLRVVVDPEPGENRTETFTDLLGGDDLIATGMLHVAREFGCQLPECSLRTDVQIPVARGLGSSAAAIVAGLQVGALLIGADALEPEVLIELGGSLEGHADNVSAAVLGGVTAAVSTECGHLASRITPSLPWQPLLFVPEAAAFTHQARGILPPTVPLEDASANIGRTALLVQAFHAGDAELVGRVMDDRLHQPYRANLFPHLLPMLSAARKAGAVGGCLSGAGPTVLLLAPDNRISPVHAALEQIAVNMHLPGQVWTPDIDDTGIVVCRNVS